MWRYALRLFAACCLVAVLTFTGAPVARASRTPATLPTYTLTDLGTLGGENSEARAINERGDVAGWAETGSVTPDGTPIRHAFLWTAAAGMRDLGALGGLHSVAHGINDRGETVGAAEAPDGQDHAFLWSEATGVRDLNPEGYDTSNARDINNRGEIVGGGSYMAPIALVWFRGRWSTLRVGAESLAFGINERGHIVTSLSMDGTRGAAVHTGYGIRFRTHAVLYYGKSGTAINNRGQIVGDRDFAPMLWRYAPKQAVQLLPPGNGHRPELNGINDRGEIVGAVHDCRHVLLDGWDGSISVLRCDLGRATLWFDRQVFDLNTRLDGHSAWVLEKANAINNRGQIVGVGFPFGKERGIRRAFLLTPIAP